MSCSVNFALILAESADMASAFARPLQDAGHHAIAVSSEQEAIRAVSALHPAVILVSMTLAGQCGAELCRRLKAESDADAPHILLISDDDDAAERLIEEDAADGSLARAASARELVARVADIFRMKRAEARLRRDFRELEARHAALLASQKQLQQSASVLKSIFESSPNAIVVSDLAANIIECNPRALELYDCDFKAELLRENGYDLTIPEDAPHARENVRDMLQSGAVKHAEYTMIKKTGERYPAEISSSVLRDEAGQPTGFVSIVRDLTERRISEKSLRESEARYRALFENSPVSLWEDDFSVIKAELDRLRQQGIHDLRAYFDAHPDDADAMLSHIRIHAFNQASIALYQANDREELLARFSEILTDDAKRAFAKAILLAANGTTAFSYETTNRTLRGKLLAVRLKISFPPGCEESWARALVTVIDLTEHKQMEDALTHERYLLRTLMEHSLDLIYFKDEQSRFLRVNTAFARRINATPDDCVGKTDADIYQREYAQKILADERRIMATGQSLVGMEEREVWPDGRVTWTSSTKLPLPDEQGKIIGTFGISRDITMRKLGEQREQLTTQVLDVLNRSHRQVDTIRTILRLMKQATDIEAVSVRLKDGNDFPYYETYGFDSTLASEERSLGRRNQGCAFIRTNEGNPALECMCGNVLNGRTDPTLPYFTPAGSFWSNSATEWIASATDADRQARIRHCCNVEGCESVALIPLRSANRIIGLMQFNDRRKGMFTPDMIHFFEGLGASIGIAFERHLAEEEIARLRSFMENIIESMPSVLLGIDRDGRITHWNRQAEKMIRLKAAEVRGKVLADVIPEILPYLEKIRDDIAQQRPHHDEKVMTRIGGEIRYFDILVYPLISDGVEGTVVRIDDVSARVRMEDMMIQSEKMLSIGGLAAGMAHEINNPLASILQNADVILSRLTRHFPANVIAALECGTNMDAIREFMLKRDIIKMLGLIQSAGERAEKIVADMLNFSRGAGTPDETHDVGELIDRAVQFASDVYDLKQRYDLKRCRIVREYDPTLPKIRCEENQIQQVVINLLINAAQAMIAQPDPAAEPTITLRTRRDDDMAHIEIEDNGPGMPEHVRKRVFEPFFTTKEVGVGTGLGLSVSYFIITRHHKGTMSVESEVGKGTKFILRLPLEEEEV